jgi:hypothetical protein
MRGSGASPKRKVLGLIHREAYPVQKIDRYDVANGSPADAVVLATSTGHPDDFGIAPEDTTFPNF